MIDKLVVDGIIPSEDEVRKKTQNLIDVIVRVAIRKKAEGSLLLMLLPFARDILEMPLSRSMIDDMTTGLLTYSLVQSLGDARPKLRTEAES